LIKSAADLISVDNPGYQYVAARLIAYDLYKKVFGSLEFPHLLDHVKKVVKLGFYTSELLDWYDTDEWDQLNKILDHNRDDRLTYAAMEQFRGKYLVKNRTNGKFYETPQIAFLLVAATGFHSYPKETRLSYVKEFYESISNGEISLATPIIAGLRTPQKQFSSCVLIECADSLDSIIATTGAIVKYVSQKAGIGIGAGAIRALGSKVRNGDTAHTGVIPFYRLFMDATASCSQGSIRKGSASLYYPLWHLEIQDLLVLKNSKGTEETRLRDMDYGVQINKLLYERLITGKDISLFSPSDVPGLYEAFFADQDKFKELYEKYEDNPKIRKTKIKSSELFTLLMQERKDTGRIYIQNVDHCNTHSSFDERVAPVRQSNLCVEITLPCVPLNSLDDENGRIQLCTLSAINWGKINKPEDFARPCSLAVRFLDEILDYQEYPVKAAELATKEYRPIGIGDTNFAYWLAKNDLTYQGITSEGLQKIAEYKEAMSYHLIKTSILLAKEKGACSKYYHTKYSRGKLPIDTYKKEVDELLPNIHHMNWEVVRSGLLDFGIRNATLMANMPCDSSSALQNATSGIDPPRALVSIKQSKAAMIKQVVPEVKRLRNKYDLMWDQKSPEGYIKIMAVLQKYMDQSISTNQKFYPDEQIPMTEMLKHILMGYKYGIKCWYYLNTNDQASDESQEECESCKL